MQPFDDLERRPSSRLDPDGDAPQNRGRDSSCPTSLPVRVDPAAA